ncbi:hypothetical protein MIMGU_mgv1a005548mg [Erythranthe guttata]|uniref:RING-type domain-containing protein n=1 Tax=Erythranthe guttata TaxID=4155 RepID=A0A022PUR0_ERYGU|nr:hypothetical protein MIMGU_mgv1a005548mg [Erythranthe guttata]
METPNRDALDSASQGSNGVGTSRIFRSRAIRFLRSPISSLLEYSGVLRDRPDYPFSEAYPLIPESTGANFNQNPRRSEPLNRNDAVDGGGTSNSGGSNNCAEVSIRIIGEQESVGGANNSDSGVNGVGLGAGESTVGAGDVNRNGNGNGNSNDDNNNREASSSERYDIQQAARWIEQILPFSLLLLVVFIRQHLQGFVVTIYSTAILFKSNDILRNQTALKGERKITILVGSSVFFMIHIFGTYWWHRRDDLFYPLIMIPPKSIPPFWHAIFIILINDTMARQTAMVFKLVLLMYYKNGRGQSFRRQGQMLTLVEYTLLLYRALLPAPVWYRFFMNKDYGSLFSSLITGLYLTFKLTSIVEKVQSFVTALKALSKKEVHYGSHATSEQVSAAGDMCAICQEKMHVPIFLRCKHIFCEDCVSEWWAAGIMQLDHSGLVDYLSKNKLDLVMASWAFHQFRVRKRENMPVMQGSGQTC